MSYNIPKKKRKKYSIIRILQNMCCTATECPNEAAECRTCLYGEVAEEEAKTNPELRELIKQESYKRFLKVVETGDSK